MGECTEHVDPLPDPRAWKRQKRDQRLRKAVEALELTEVERATVLRYVAASEAEYLMALSPDLGVAPVPLPAQADRVDCSEVHRSRKALGDLRQLANAMERMAR
jgi:hypothetical protein